VAVGSSIRLPDARFSCHSCGRCCTIWSVTVDEAKVAKLREHDWSSIAPGDPFEKNRGPGEAYRLRMRKGRCFFLAEDNRCQIHAKLGYDAKPEGCKAFPLHFTEVGARSYARLSFYCPSVSGGKGKKLRDQMRWVRATRKAAGDVSREDALTLDGDVELTQREIDALHERLKEILERRELELGDRLAAGAALLARISERAEERRKGALASVLEQTKTKAMVEALAAAGRAEGKSSRAGPIFSLFLGADCGAGKLARMGHFFGVRFFNIGLGKLRSKAMQASASRSKLRATRFDPSAEGQALLERYIAHKLEGRRHLGGSTTLIGGFNLLIASYALINVLARVSAAAAGRSCCDDHDVQAAVEAADLLVVEHTTLRRGKLFGQLVEAILGQRGLAASLLARVDAP